MATRALPALRRALSLRPQQPFLLTGAGVTEEQCAAAIRALAEDVMSQRAETEHQSFSRSRGSFACTGHSGLRARSPGTSPYQTVKHLQPGGHVE